MTFNPWEKYAGHPKVNRAGVPRIRREWLGDTVCIRYMKARGHAYRRSTFGYLWGTLSQSCEAHLVTVIDHDGKEVPVHYRRVMQVWNLSQSLPVDAKSDGIETV